MRHVLVILLALPTMVSAQFGDLLFQNDFEISQPASFNILFQSNGLDNAGGFDLVFGSDGLPVAAFAARNSDDQPRLMVARCQHINCETGTLYQTVPMGLGSSIQNVSVAIASNGLPMIAFRGIDEGVSVVQCLTLDCSLHSPARILSSGNASLIKLVIGSDGLPMIAYQHLGSGVRVRFARCLDSDCSGLSTDLLLEGTGTEIFGPGLFRANNGDDLTMGIGDNGFPLLVYRISPLDSNSLIDHRLRVASCQSLACDQSPVFTALTALDADLDPEFSLHNDAAFRGQGNGPPVIAFQGRLLNDGSRVAAIHVCDQDACSSGTSRQLSPVDHPVFRQVRPLFSTDDSPLIVYTSTSNNLLMVECSSSDCSGEVTTSTFLAADASGPTRDFQLAPGTDDRLLGLIFSQVPNQPDLLRFVRCPDANCPALP